jgi:hypothetical protein
VTAYSGFGPTGVYDVVTANERGESLVYAAELADGYADNGCPGGQLGSLEVVDRLLAGMQEHDRPLALIAGDPTGEFGHVAEVARELIERTTGQQMMLDQPEWMGVIIELAVTFPPRRARQLVLSLGGESQRLVLAVMAGGDADGAMRWIKAMYPPGPPQKAPIELVMATACPQCDAKPGEKCLKPTGDFAFRPHKVRAIATGYKPPPRPPVPTLMIVFDEDLVDRRRVMAVYRLLERREPLRGRGVILLPRRRRLFEAPSTGGR